MDNKIHFGVTRKYLYSCYKKMNAFKDKDEKL